MFEEIMEAYRPLIEAIKQNNTEAREQMERQIAVLERIAHHLELIEVHLK